MDEERKKLLEREKERRACTTGRGREPRAAVARITAHAFDTPEGRDASDLWRRRSDGAALCSARVGSRAAQRRTGDQVDGMTGHLAPRHRVRRHLARPACRHPALSPAHGVALRLGVIARQRVQFRLRRELFAGGTGHGRGQLQLPQGLLPGGGGARHQRLPQGRCGRRVPHLFHLRPRRRSHDGRLCADGPHAAGP